MHAMHILMLALAAVVSQAARADDFYQGKTINIVVGYSPGGGYDVNARLIARHLGRHVPGNPMVVVVNMPGAGSLRSVEYIERHAPKDGTVINMFDYTQITNSLLTPDKVPVDFRKFKWIGSVAQDLAVCYVWHSVKAKTIADLQRLPVINMGRTNPGTSSDTQQSTTSPAGGRPCSRQRRRAETIMASPPFMSRAPRPQSQPSTSSPEKGG